MKKFTNAFIGSDGNGESYQDLDETFKEKNNCFDWKTKFGVDAQNNLCKKPNYVLKNDNQLKNTGSFFYGENDDDMTDRCCREARCIKPTVADQTDILSYDIDEIDTRLNSFNVIANGLGCKPGWKSSNSSGITIEPCKKDGEYYILSGCNVDTDFKKKEACSNATALHQFCGEQGKVVNYDGLCSDRTCLKRRDFLSGNCCVEQQKCADAGSGLKCSGEKVDVKDAKCIGAICKSSDFTDKGSCCKNKPQLCSAENKIKCAKGTERVTDTGARCAGLACKSSDFTDAGSCCVAFTPESCKDGFTKFRTECTGPGETKQENNNCTGKECVEEDFNPDSEICCRYGNSSASIKIDTGGGTTVGGGTTTTTTTTVQTYPTSVWNQKEGQALNVKSANKEYIYRKYGYPTSNGDKGDLKVEDCKIICEQNAGGQNWSKPCAGFNFKYTIPEEEPNKCLFFSSEAYNGGNFIKIPNDNTYTARIAMATKKGHTGAAVLPGSLKTTYHTFWMPDAVETSEPFTNMKEGFTTQDEIKNAFINEGSGFTPSEWNKSSSYFKTQILKDKYAISQIPSPNSNIPCTKNYTDYQYPDGTKDINISKPKEDVQRDFVYQVGSQKFCPPFKPNCNSQTNICEGEIRKPIVPNTKDWEYIEDQYKSDKNINTKYYENSTDKKLINPLQKISESTLTTNNYCTNDVLSYCKEGVIGTKKYKFCDIPGRFKGGYKKPGKNNFESATILDLEKAGEIGINGIYAPVPYDDSKRLKLIGCKNDEDCNIFGRSFRCADGTCVSEDGRPASSAITQRKIDNKRNTGTVTDNLLEAENLDLTKESAESKFKNYFDGEIKRFKLDEGGTLGESLDKQNYNNLGKTLNILKTRYIFTFNLEKKIIYWLEKTRDLEKINLDIRNELNKFKQTKEYKQANGNDIIKFSYNKEAVIKSLLKLGKTNKNFKYINLEWISTRIEKTKDNCEFDKDSGNCNNSLLFTDDLDEQTSQWGLIKRKAFKKKEQELTSNWQKLSDNSDVGKYLYKKSQGPRGSRKVFDENYQSPHENNYILLGN